MTNESLKAAIAEFGNRVVFIIMDNDRRLRFGYPESPLQSVDQLKYKTFNEMLRVLASITSNNEYFGSREFVEHFTESIEKNNSYAYIWNDKFNIEHCVSVFVKTFDCGNNI